MSCCSSLFRSVMRSAGAARVEVVPHRCAGQPTLTEPQGSGEGFPAHREVVTLGRGVQVCSSSGCGGRRIGHDGRVAVCVRAGDHPQQLALGGSLPASDAGPDRSREGEASGRVEILRWSPPTDNPTRCAARIPNRQRPCTPIRAYRRCHGPSLLGPVHRSRPSIRPSGSPTTCPPGRPRGGDGRVRTASTPTGLTLDVPVVHPLLVPGHPSTRRCGCRASSRAAGPGPVGGSLRPAAVHRRTDASARSSPGSRAGCPVRAASRSPRRWPSPTGRWPRSALERRSRTTPRRQLHGAASSASFEDASASGARARRRATRRAEVRRTWCRR